MKAKSGFFQRTLTLFIILGLVAGISLVWMGHQKAEKAIDKTPVANLYPTYAGTAAVPDGFDASLLKAVLTKFSADNANLNKYLAFFSDHTLAEVITEHLYLPADETVSTAIGQRFVVRRLEKTYSQEELLLICYGLLGYDLKKGEIPDFSDYLSSENAKALAALSENARSFLTDILTFLQNQKLISPSAQQ